MMCRGRYLDKGLVQPFAGLLSSGGWHAPWKETWRCCSADTGTMGRGCGWSAEELQHLAQAWVFASEDPVTGIDQTAARFRATLFDRFKALAPVGASDKTYGGRTAKSARAKFDEISADVQKFRDSLRKVTVCQPSGVNSSNILSMAIAIHMGRRTAMDYNARDYPHTEWRNHLAYAVLKDHPKFSDEGMAYGALTSSISNLAGEEAEGIETGAAAPVAQEADNVGNEGSHSMQDNRDIPSSNNESVDEAAAGGSVLDETEPKKGERPRGRKSEIRIRAIDKQRVQSVENVRLIAQSLERRNELEEERSALVAYSRDECETEEDLRDRAEYLRLLRKDRLKALRKRILASEQGTPMPPSCSEPSPEDSPLPDE